MTRRLRRHPHIGLVPARQVVAVGVLSLTALLASCGSHPPDSAGAGGLVGHMSHTSDVEGQPGDPAVRGGGLAVIPIAAMDGAFWRLTGEERVADPRGWAHLATQLSVEQVSELDGTVSPTDGGGDFRLSAPAGEYAVCYWPHDIGGRVTGCEAIDLPAEGDLEATWGEGGFHIRVAD